MCLDSEFHRGFGIKASALSVPERERLSIRDVTLSGKAAGQWGDTFNRVPTGRIFRNGVSRCPLSTRELPPPHTDYDCTFQPPESRLSISTADITACVLSKNKVTAPHNNGIAININEAKPLQYHLRTIPVPTAPILLHV